ncbi:MAG: hypothetical protein O2782_01950 [bacterium]|nr:hypothetical protein [bacterium]
MASSAAPPSRGTWLLGLTRASLALCIVLAVGCSYFGYHHVVGPLQPTPTQAEEMSVEEDGAITFTRGRLEIRLRPVTSDELNQQFSSASEAGNQSTNPYTFSNTTFQDGLQHKRFTVFHLKVKNYAYPKVLVKPTMIEIVASNSRRYWSLDLSQLDNYFRAYAIGYRGNEYDRYQKNMETLQRTMYPAVPIFSGQEAEGYIVFPTLHTDVRVIDVVIHEAALRFDTRDEPMETIDLSYSFGRDVRRQLPGSDSHL